LTSTPSGEETVFSFFEFGKKITRQDIEEKISYLKAMDPEAEEKRARMEVLLYSARQSDSQKDLVALGDRWSDPKSPDHHIEMAKKAYQYAAEKNHPEAQLKLASLLYRQAKEVRDYANAYFWAKAAVMNGNKGASELLSKAREKLPAEHLPAIEAEIKEALKMLVEGNNNESGKQ
jgi:TPR repeat protein